jgi:ribosome biogenesis GTPase
LLTSTLTGAGLIPLHDRLIDQTTVLTGLSGVGKSSLITAVDPSLNLKTGSVGEAGGRHTTTQANWLPLAAGGAVVDTPGIREFGLSGLTQDDLIEFMPDLAEFAAGCRFNDCRHLDEPGCAVQAAVKSGELAESRHYSYTKMLRELPE